MNLYNNKKGQAAIEFLMTYGWMLLVVLIVGALIFSFVDFGSLLPNKIEMGNNLQPSATESYASATSLGSSSHSVVVFSYSGAKQSKINVSDPGNKIESTVDGSSCELVWLKNVDTDTSTNATKYDSNNDGGASPASGLTPGGTVSKDDTVVFLNSQIGIAEFNCSDLNGGVGLIENDALEGKITIITANAKTQVPTPNSGNIRLSISE